MRGVGRDALGLRSFAGKSGEDAVEHPHEAPAYEAIVERLVWPIGVAIKDGADDGTRTRTLTEKQIFVPLRLSPPPDGVRGLDCPFAMARRL